MTRPGPQGLPERKPPVVVPRFRWPPVNRPRDPATILVLTLKDGDVVEVWQREDHTGAQLADILRKAADRFERSGVRRIR